MKMNWKKLRENIPNRIRVKPRCYFDILWVQDFWEDKEGHKTYGKTTFDPNQIILNVNQGDRETVLTLVHEIYHAISTENEMSLTESEVIKLENSFPYLLEVIMILLQGTKKK